MKLNARHKIGLRLAEVLPFSWSWKLLKIPSGEVSARDCGKVILEVREDLIPHIPERQGPGPFGEMIGSEVFAFNRGYDYSTHWGANLTHQGELIRDLSRQGIGSKHAHFSFGKPRVKSARRIRGTVATLTVEHRSNYFHFLSDSIARLQLIQNLQQPPDYIYIQSNLDYQKEILSRLGYQAGQIIDSHRNPFIQADTLLVPKYISNIAMFSANSISFLRSKLKKGLSEPPVSRGRIVYISRRDSPRRKILNEDKLLDQLSGFQVECVVLSELSVALQIELFESADIVIAQMGASVANLIFARKDLFLVLLTPPNFLEFALDVIKSFGQPFFDIVTSDYPPEAKPFDHNVTLTDEEIQAIVQAVAGAKTPKQRAAS